MINIRTLLLLLLLTVSGCTKRTVTHTTEDDIVTLFAHARDDQEIHLLSQTYVIDEPVVLRGKRNIKIVCKKETQVLCTDSRKDVFRIELCDDITIENGSFGHRIPRDQRCAESVFTIIGSRHVSLSNCDIFGCGATGIHAQGSEDIQLRGCSIRDNSWTAFRLNTCNSITAIECTYEDNYTFKDVYNCTNINLGENKEK